MSTSELQARPSDGVSSASAPCDAALLDPGAANDGCSLDELAQRYNFERTSDRRGVFTRAVIDELRDRPSPRRAIDIGCGAGFGGSSAYQWAIRMHADEFWGLEPDDTVSPDEGLFDRVVRSPLESAALPDAHFDVATAFLVMEHVTDPGAFVGEVARILKPGGAFLFLTMNARHYFTRAAARLARALHIDEAMLRLVRGSETVESYHYPVVYRFNSPGQVRRAIDGARGGAVFEEPVFAYLEQIGPKPYFPGPLRAIFWAGRQHRKVRRRPEILQDLLGRLRRPLVPLEPAAPVVHVTAEAERLVERDESTARR